MSYAYKHAHKNKIITQSNNAMSFSLSSIFFKQYFLFLILYLEKGEVHQENLEHALSYLWKCSCTRESKEWTPVFDGIISGPEMGREHSLRLELLLYAVLTQTMHASFSRRQHKGQLYLSRPCTRGRWQASEKKVIGCIFSAGDTCPAVQEFLRWKFYKWRDIQTVICSQPPAVIENHYFSLYFLINCIRQLHDLF